MSKFQIEFNHYAQLVVLGLTTYGGLLVAQYVPSTAIAPIVAYGAPILAVANVVFGLFQKSIKVPL